ncbi:hypothetical protein L0B53_11595 [Vibrio sp. SS-MA-C1-2]|uniref:hypothetical protein n=1 Tax=Vibrio sp. SS-MA-C1-2 TaxID=2908646 RepID=UPI001F1B5EF7|nr:hypothetical protein [Vibrio sp. SS-MA-C1-2]UJF17677.1 hypothetical protein L0B53_11595 [Vibrio sp. SS-MA-C1-2]
MMNFSTMMFNNSNAQTTTSQLHHLTQHDSPSFTELNSQNKWITVIGQIGKTDALTLNQMGIELEKVRIVQPNQQYSTTELANMALRHNNSSLIIVLDGHCYRNELTNTFNIPVINLYQDRLH